MDTRRWKSILVVILLIALGGCSGQGSTEEQALINQLQASRASVVQTSSDAEWPLSGTEQSIKVNGDLVEVYAIRLGIDNEYRVYKAYAPAWDALRWRFTAPYFAFTLLTFAGISCIAAAAWLSIHRLAAPGSLGIFLLLQSGILLDLVTRFWQRAIEVRLAEDVPSSIPRHEEDTLEPVPISPWPRPIQTDPEREISES